MRHCTVSIHEYLKELSLLGVNPRYRSIEHQGVIMDDECGYCGGKGWVEALDHHPDCYAKLECIGCGGIPVQVQCEACAEADDPDENAPF